MKKRKISKPIIAILAVISIMFTSLLGLGLQVANAASNTSDGKITANFGSPEIDGKIDDVWNKAEFVSATASGSSSISTTAKFKTLWDDNALYVLADVTDSALDVTSGTVYNRDCVEIFLG
jgi:hypothetical protein